jgi:hypothetical protein
MLQVSEDSETTGIASYFEDFGVEDRAKPD